MIGRRQFLALCPAIITFGMFNDGKAATLSLPPDSLDKLRRLRQTPKFKAEGLYAGVLPERQRLRAEIVLNFLIDQLIDAVPQQPTKELVLGHFKMALDRVDLVDTEDRERMCLYLEEIMDYVGLESSDGLLNT